MTPDDHAARARDLLRTADEILARATDENAGRPSENPMVHQQLQTFALLAQAHATLSLRQPDLPEGAGASRQSSGGPNLGRNVPAVTRQPATELPAFRNWERLSETDVTELGLPDDGDLPDLDDATDGPFEHKDYYQPQDGPSPGAYGDDDDLPD